jgi:hypothetical protein
MILFRPINPFLYPVYIDLLINQGIDPYDKKLGHGMIPLGKVINIEDTKDKLTTYPHINKILIKETPWENHLT